MYAYSRKATADHVLHIVNYDYDPTRDRFKTKRNVQVELARPRGRYEAQWIRPGDTAAEILPVTWSSGFAQVTVPSLTSYGVLTLEEVSVADTRGRAR